MQVAHAEVERAATTDFDGGLTPDVAHGNDGRSLSDDHVPGPFSYPICVDSLDTVLVLGAVLYVLVPPLSVRAVGVGYIDSKCAFALLWPAAQYLVASDVSAGRSPRQLYGAMRPERCEASGGCRR